MSSTGQRQDEIDWLKAIAIVTVVYIHAYIRWTNSPTQIEQIRTVLTAAAVPAFFFASGLLTTLRPAALRPRLTRLLIPYCVASSLALALQWGRDPTHMTLQDTMWDLLTGNAVGIYYFVFSLLAITLMTQPLLGAPTWMRRCALAAALGIGLLEASGIVTWPFYWSLRSPGRWLGFYLLGAEIAALKTGGATWLRGAAFPRICFAAAAASACLACFATGPSLQIGLLVYAYCLVVGIALAFADRPAPVPVRWLSEASYTIYLYHIFIVQEVLRGSADGNLDRFSALVAGFGGAVLFTLAVRRLAGARSRLLFG